MTIHYTTPSPETQCHLNEDTICCTSMLKSTDHLQWVFYMRCILTGSLVATYFLLLATIEMVCIVRLSTILKYSEEITALYRTAVKHWRLSLLNNCAGVEIAAKVLLEVLLLQLVCFGSCFDLGESCLITVPHCHLTATVAWAGLN